MFGLQQIAEIFQFESLREPCDRLLAGAEIATFRFICLNLKNINKSSNEKFYEKERFGPILLTGRRWQNVLASFVRKGALAIYRICVILEVHAPG